MSNLPIDLSDRRVVGAVLALLALVLMLNWSVFRPGGGPHKGTHAFVEDTVRLPSDLDEQTRTAARQLSAAHLGSGLTTLPDAGMGAAVTRDPFRLGAPVPEKPRPQKTQRRAQPAAPVLHCQAVLLGSGAPVALINGAPFSVGEHLQGFTVLQITDKGVWLRNDNKKIFLPVGSQTDKNVDYQLVTGQGQEQGRTRIHDK